MEILPLTKDDIAICVNYITEQYSKYSGSNNTRGLADRVEYAMEDKELLVKQAQITKLADDQLTASKQRDLYQRQIEGFDDNKYQKLFESQLSSWGLMFSSGMLTEKPSIITGDEVSKLYTKLTTGI